MFDELAQTREMLNSRYDDLKSGRVKPIDGEEFFESLRRREDELLNEAFASMTQSQALTFTRSPRRTSPRFGNTLRQITRLAADRVREEIFGAIRALVPFPGQGHRRPDLTSRPLRFILVREYLIAYAPEEKPLWVVAVMHGRRSPRVMAAILRGRE